MSSKRTKGARKAESGDNTSPESDDSVPKSAEKPVSLAPLEFEEALRDLLKVKPDRPKGQD